jgi:hypothetical protein
MSPMSLKSLKSSLLFKTSFFLLFPVYIAYIKYQYDIAIATMSIFVTSILNHGFHTKTLRLLDVSMIHSFGIMYAFEGVFRILMKQWIFLLPCILQILCCITYWMVTRNKNRVHIHMLIHLCGSVGISLFVCTREVVQRNNVISL